MPLRIIPSSLTLTLLEAGLPTIQTITWGAKSTYANNQTVIDVASGITYELEVDTGTFTPTGGDMVVLDIHTATTAAQVEAIATPAMVAESGSHWTAVVGGAGTSTFTAKTAGSANNAPFAGTAAITVATTQQGGDPIVVSGNQNITGTASGQLFAYDDDLKQFVALPVPVDGGFLVADSTEDGGWKVYTFETRNAFHTDTVSEGAVSVSGEYIRHRVVLGNGANTVSVSNLSDGTPCTLKIIQPASGAAGTVTLSGYTFKPATVTLTATNSGWNYLVLIRDSTSATVSVSTSENFAP